METQIKFIVKLFLLSTVLSLLIKYSGIIVTVNPSKTNGLVIVILPTLILGLALMYRSINQIKQE